MRKRYFKRNPKKGSQDRTAFLGFCGKNLIVRRRSGLRSLHWWDGDRIGEWPQAELQRKPGRGKGVMKIPAQQEGSPDGSQDGLR